MTEKEKKKLGAPSNESLAAMLGAVETAQAFKVAGARWRDGELGSRFEAVQAAVGKILEVQFPDLDAGVLGVMQETISIALLTDTKSAARVAQLLGEPAL